MNANRMTTERGYWLAWFLASVMGYGTGGILGAALASRFFHVDTFQVAHGITVGIVLGAAGGYFQWVVLREQIARAGWWGLASALGFGLAIGAVIASGADQYFAIAGLLLAAIFGAVSGVLQWLILRRKVARAGWWLLANLLGSLVGAIAVPIAGLILGAGHWEIGLLIFGLLFGTGYGAITGAALVWLLRQSSSDHVEGLAAVH